MSDAGGEQTVVTQLAPTRWLSHRAFEVGLTLAAAYVVLRTVGVGEQLIVAWTAAAVAAAVAWPLAGLTILAALGPFVGAVEDDGRITSVPFLLAGLGLGLLARLARTRPLPRLLWPTDRDDVVVRLAVLLMILTALGVAISWVVYGVGRGIQAAQLWVPGIGGALTVFLGSAWVARQRDMRPLVVVAASVATAALISLVDFVTLGAVNASGLGWTVHDQPDMTRLAGIILAPNAAATIFLVGLSVSAAWSAFGAGRRLRLLAFIAASITLAAVLLTFSRSALIALALLALVFAWRWRRWVGVVATLAIAALLAVAYVLFANGDMLREVPAVADQQRLEAWGAAIRIWFDHPLLGAGFRSFEWLHADYGAQLDAPHNEWLRFLAEEGIVGGLVGAALFAAVVLAVSRSRGPVAIGVISTAISMAVMASFNNPFTYVQVNIPVFAVLGFYALRRRPLSRLHESEEDEVVRTEIGRA